MNTPERGGTVIARWVGLLSVIEVNTDALNAALG